MTTRIPMPVQLTATLIAVVLVLPSAAAVKARDKTVGMCGCRTTSKVKESE